MSTSTEVTFGPDELIVSKTDLKGHITYANRHFMRISNFAEKDLMGKPHSIIRHPDMPRGVYHGMWKTLKSGQEFFGFVKNYTSDKNYYWVFANVTPDRLNGKTVGFFSVRRHMPRAILPMIEDLYRQMRELEQKLAKNEAPKQSWQWLEEHLRELHGTSYEEVIIAQYLTNQS